MSSFITHTFISQQFKNIKKIIKITKIYKSFYSLEIRPKDWQFNEDTAL